MWKLDHKESWAPKNWCFWTVVLKKILESHLDCKEIQPVNPKGSQPWIFIGRTDAEAEAPVLWPPDAKIWLIGKDPDAGKDWKQEKGKTEDEMVGWHHWLNGHELEQAPGVGDGQGSLVCCSPWDRRVGHNWATEQQPSKPGDSGSLCDFTFLTYLRIVVGISFCLAFHSLLGWGGGLSSPYQLAWGQEVLPSLWNPLNLPFSTHGKSHAPKQWQCV